MLLAGCGTQAIVVSEAAIADRPDARVVGWTAQDTPRQVFSPEDEEVALHARFQFNYRAVYEWYRVEWIAPDGSPYKVVSLRTDFGSHRDIKASLKIRGKMASRMPGLWRARLWLQGREGAPDRLLISRLFRIAEPTPAMLAAGLTSVDEAPASTERPLARRAPALPEQQTPMPSAGVGPTAVTMAGVSPPPPRPNEDVLLLPPVGVVPLTEVGPATGVIPPKDVVPATDVMPPLAQVPATSVMPSVAQAPPAGAVLPLAQVPAPPRFVPPVGVMPPLRLVPPLGLGAGRSAGDAEPAAASGGKPTAKQGQGTVLATAKVEKSPAPSPAKANEVLRPSSAAGGLASVTLTSKPAVPGAPLREPFRRRYPGCPPLYYLPGPGCVEQAPEE